MIQTLRTLIVDDEPLAIERLQILTGQQDGVSLVGTASDGASALRMVDALAPDLVLCDIAMPDLNGLEVAAAIDRLDNPPAVIFVTAFDQYAVEAFEANAVDYVLKPYSDARLQAAVERLKERLASVPAPAPQDLGALVASIAAKLNPQGEKLKWIKASVGTTLRLIPIDDVLFFQSGEKYTMVATKELDALIRTPIKEIIDGIDAGRFWQIHRSTVVNASAIESVSRDFRGQATVKVKGRKENLVVSRPFSHLFKQM